MAVVHGVHGVITMDVVTAPDHVQGVVRMAPGVAMVMVMDLAIVMVTDMVMVTDTGLDTVPMVTMVPITLVPITLVRTTSDHTLLDRIHSCRAASAAARGRCGKARSFFGTAACRGPWRRARHAGEAQRGLDHVQFHEVEVVDITAEAVTSTGTDTDTDTDMATKVRTMTVD